MNDFLNGQPDQKYKANRPKPSKTKRILIGIGTVFLLIGIVFFSQNIDTILDFFGVRADQATIDISLDPPEGPPGDPPEGPTVDLGPNQSYTWYLNVKSIWGTHPATGEPQPFKGTITFYPPDLASMYPLFIDSVEFVVPEHPLTTGDPHNDPTVPIMTITDDPSDLNGLLGIFNWRPVADDQQFIEVPAELTITTKDYDTGMGGFEIPFELPVTLEYNPSVGFNSIPDPDDPAVEIPPPPPAEGTIYLEGEDVVNPDFSLEITDPVDINEPEGDPEGWRHNRTVTAGTNAIYEIEITTNETFGIAGDGVIDLTFPELEIAKGTPGSGVLDYNISPNPCETEGSFCYITGPNDPYDPDNPDIILTVETDENFATNPPGLPFSINGTSDQIGSLEAAGGVPVVGFYIVRDGDYGRLTTDLLPDFSLILGNIVASTTYADELDRDVVIPGGSITYNVTLDRINGFTGNVSLDSISLNTNWPTEIDYYEFANGGQFVDDGNPQQSTTITIYITDTEDTQITDIGRDFLNPLDPPFFLDGYGDIDGDDTPEHKPSNEGKFSIVDYTITVQNTPQTVGAGSPAVYNILITPENEFNDLIYLSLTEDLVANYPQHINNVGLQTDPLTITASDTGVIVQLTIETNSESPGTDPGGIPFHVQGDSQGLLRHVESNEGILHVNSNQNFTLQLTPLKNRVVPGGEATYEVAAIGWLGFAGAIDLSTNWDDPDMPDWVESITFDDNTILPGPSEPGTPTILHIQTTNDASPISSTVPPAEGQFRVFGDSGELNDYVIGTIDIVDFTIEITDPESPHTRSISSGDSTTYTAVISRGNNEFTEDIILSTDLVSIYDSISSLWFDGPDVVFIGDEYILQYSGLADQLITLHVETKDPIPVEIIEFYLYGDAVTNEGDPIGHPSEKATLNITNEYGFDLLISEPVTVAPTGTATYNISVSRLNGFNGDITIDPVVAALDNAILAGQINSYNFDNLTLDEPIGGSDTSTLTVVAYTDAVGELIPFVIWGTADLSGLPGDITYDSASSEINIIDFTLDVLPDSPQSIGPGGTIQFTVRLSSTGATTFTENIALSHNIFTQDANGIVDQSETGFTVGRFSQYIVSGINPVTGYTDIILFVKAKDDLSGIDNHLFSFIVEGRSTVGEVNLLRSDSGVIDFKNTPYFELTLSPRIVYSFPGDLAQFDIHVNRYHDYSDQINLNLTSVLPPLVENPYFEVGGIVQNYLPDGVDDAILYIPITEDLVTLRNYLHLTTDNDDLPISVTGVGIYDGASDGDTGILRIRDFKIGVTPSIQETYPDDTAQYTVTLTRYNTYAGHDEDINLSSNVYRSETQNYILPFNPATDFANSGIFPADPLGDGTERIYTTNMTIRTADINPDSLDILIGFVVDGAGDTTNLTRQDNAELNIVAVPEFDLTLTPDVDGRGIPTETVDYTIDLSRDFGFDGNVTITDVNITDSLGQELTEASWQIDGDNMVFSGSETSRGLHVSLADATNYWGDYTVTIRGIGQGIAEPRFAEAPLIVMDFGVSLTDNTKEVTPDSNVSYEVVLTRYNGYDRNVIASTDLLTGWPSDISDVGFNLIDDTFTNPGINPGETVQQTALMVVHTTVNADEQTIQFTVTGTDATPTALQRSTIGWLNIVASPDYNLTITAKDGINSGMPTESLTYIVTLNGMNDYIGPVNITEIIFSDDTDIENITWLNGDTTLLGEGDTVEFSFDLGADINWGDRTVQVMGTGTPGDHYSNEALVRIFDFDIEIAPPKNQSITDTAPNNIATYVINLIRHNNYNRAVAVETTLTPANYPGIISSSVFTNGGTFPAGTTTPMPTDLIVYAEDNAPDPINFDVIGTDSPTGLQRSDSGSLLITDGTTPNFLVNITPNSRTIEPGASTTYTVTVTRINFDGTITLTTNLLSLDNRVESADFYNLDNELDNQLLPGETEATLMVVSKVGSESSENPTTFDIFGDSNGLQRSASADLIIYIEPEDEGEPGGGGTPTPRDFAVAIEPEERTVMAGEKTTYTVIINRTNFTGDILLNQHVADDPNIKSATLDRTIIENDDREPITLTVITEPGADATSVPIIVTGTAIIDRRETERDGEAILYIRRDGGSDEDEIEDIIVPEEELPSTGPEFTWLLLGLAALLLTSSAYRKLD